MARLWENKLSLDQTEKTILSLIASAQGDQLVSDEQLIDALQNSKSEQQEMREKSDKLEQD